MATETASLFREEASYNRAQLWASDFYGVRNDLVHGKPDAEAASPLAGIRLHEEIALRVFRMCVRERLAEYVPGNPARGGEPDELSDLGFDDWVVGE
jgi:hypothetical protein